MIVADFTSEYQIRLACLPNEAMTWREFEQLLSGLMSADTRLARHFAPRQDERGADS